MQIPVQLTFTNTTPSDAVRERVLQHVEKLGRHSDRIMSCRVVIEAPHRPGRPFVVRIDVSLPGSEIIISRPHEDRAGHDDVYVAVRDAFQAAERKVEELARKRRANWHPARPGSRTPGI